MIGSPGLLISCPQRSPAQARRALRLSLEKLSFPHYAAEQVPDAKLDGDPIYCAATTEQHPSWRDDISALLFSKIFV